MNCKRAILLTMKDLGRCSDADDNPRVMAGVVEMRQQSISRFPFNPGSFLSPCENAQVTDPRSSTRSSTFENTVAL